VRESARGQRGGCQNDQSDAAEHPAVLYQPERAEKKTGAADFRDHDYRHRAQTAWAVKNVPGPIAMKMAGLASAQMLQRYQNIKPRHVTEFMSKLEKGGARMVDTDGRHEGTRDDKERATS
jgi:hypothetical protein